MTDNGTGQPVDDNMTALVELMLEVPAVRALIASRLSCAGVERGDPDPRRRPRTPGGAKWTKSNQVDPLGQRPPAGVTYNDNCGARYVVDACDVDQKRFTISVPIELCASAEDALAMAKETREGMRMIATGWRAVPREMRRRVAWAISRLPGTDDGFPLQVRQNGGRQ